MSKAFFFFHRASVSRKASWNELAYEDITIAIQKEPSNSSTYFPSFTLIYLAYVTLLGTWFHDDEQLENATQCFDEAIILDPKVTPLLLLLLISTYISENHYWKGVVLKEKGELNASLVCFDRAIELESDNPIYFEARGSYTENKNLSIRKCAFLIIGLPERLEGSEYLPSVRPM